MDDITGWIRLAAGGDAEAGNRLYQAVYDDLRRLARRLVREQGGDRVQATSLVHEVWLRMARAQSLALVDRKHFFAVAARAMRQLVLDRVRLRQRLKRGGDHAEESLEQDLTGASVDARDAESLALEQALTRLTAFDAWLGELVELRYFAGLSMEGIGELCDRSSRALKQDWRRARAFLHAQLGGDGTPDDE
jgi:RNA polymerase sigma factor (TIGR02999 family)